MTTEAQLKPLKATVNCDMGEGYGLYSMVSISASSPGPVLTSSTGR